MKSAKKCPVCSWEINDGGRRVKLGKREIVVCCDECAAKAREASSRASGDRTGRSKR